MYGADGENVGRSASGTGSQKSGKSYEVGASKVAGSGLFVTRKRTASAIAGAPGGGWCRYRKPAVCGGKGMSR